MYKLTTGNSVIRLADNALIPSDPNNSDRIEYESWLAKGNAPQQPGGESPEQAFLRLQGLVQTRLDEWARERGYESILSLCTYATSTVPQFQAEGQRGVEVRDACWQFGYQLLEKVQAGLAEIPSEDELLQMLPPMDWSV